MRDTHWEFAFRSEPLPSRDPVPTSSHASASKSGSLTRFWIQQATTEVLWVTPIPVSAMAPPLLLERDLCGLTSEDYLRIAAADRLAQGLPQNVTAPAALAHIA